MPQARHRTQLRGTVRRAHAIEALQLRADQTAPIQRVIGFEIDIGAARQTISRRAWRSYPNCARGDAAHRLTVAFQVVIGTMINAALNDPGPLSIEDDAMTEALAQMLTLYASPG